MVSLESTTQKSAGGSADRELSEETKDKMFTDMQSAVLPCGTGL